MTERTEVLDLFCGVGGATAGYLRAGLNVVAGVDVADQPDYPGHHVKGDAFAVLERMDLSGIGLIHASCPCQHRAAITKGTNAHRQHLHPDLYEPTRDALRATGIPYVIETTGIPRERVSLTLCGEMFGLRVTRHRTFELGGWSTEKPEHVPHRGRTLGMRHGRLTTEANGGYYFPVYGAGGYKGTVNQWRDAMDIHWTRNRKSLAEAIPPAYTEWVGARFLSRT
jgi:hypothetical protein